MQIICFLFQRTPLIVAASNDCLEIVKYLISIKANVNALDKNMVRSTHQINQQLDSKIVLQLILEAVSLISANARQTQHSNRSQLLCLKSVQLLLNCI